MPFVPIAEKLKRAARIGYVVEEEVAGSAAAAVVGVKGIPDVRSTVTLRLVVVSPTTVIVASEVAPTEPAQAPVLIPSKVRS